MTPSNNEEMDGSMEPAGWSDLEMGLLRAGRVDPPRATEHAVLAALGLELPGPGGPGGESLAPPAASGPAHAAPVGTFSAAGSGGGLVLAKWTALAALVAAVPVAWFLTTERPTAVGAPAPVAPQVDAATRAPVAPAPVERAPEQRALGLDELPSEAPTRTDRPAPAREATVQLDEAPSAGSSLSLELAAIRRARSALSAGRAQESLALLNEHQKTFPVPQLGSEALVLRIETLVKLGRKDEARRLASPVTAGDSPYAQRVRALLE